jgi:predicted HicB family RNase H-like nuclease
VRVAEPRKSVATWLPESAHDRLIEAANKRDISVSDYIRRVIILTLR